MDIKEWKQIATRGTSGDQVWSILTDWQKSMDELIIMYQTTMDNAVNANNNLDIAVEALEWYAQFDEGMQDIAREALAKMNRGKDG